MENRNFSDIGRDIGKAVKDAIHSNEFSELKHTVKDAVNTAKQTVKRPLPPKRQIYKRKKPSGLPEVRRTGLFLFNSRDAAE